MHDQAAMQVRAWTEAQQLGALWSPLVHTVTSWIASAAPARATVEQRLLACLDLGTCFLLLDDATDDARARHDDLEHVASGGAPAHLVPPAPSPSAASDASAPGPTDAAAQDGGL